MKLIDQIRDWWIDRHYDYVAICQANEHLWLSPRVWKLIEEDLRNRDKELPMDGKSWLDDPYLFFKKYRSKSGPFSHEYLMLVSSTDGCTETADGGPVFTAPIQMSRSGHIGTQSVQPTPAELVAVFGLDPYARHFSDIFRLAVKPIDYYYVEGIKGKAFVVTFETVGDPISLNTTDEDE